MNVYDFDNTIYDGDSTIDFYFYCLKSHPSILLWLPRQLCGLVKYKLKIINKTIFKEYFFCFLKGLPTAEIDVIQFWNQKEGKIKEWYKKAHKNDDVIISASPEFLLNEICKRIGVSVLIASKVDIETGKFEGQNCYGKEKPVRFRAVFPSEIIEEFYTDSKSDQPMADISNKSYLVHKNRRREWNE